MANKKLVRLKDAKAAYRRGNPFKALGLLRKLRIKLLETLADETVSEQEKIESRQLLALVNHQLSVSYEALGNEKMADKRAKEAIKFYSGPNRLGFAILLRDEGMRMFGRGDIDAAGKLIKQAHDMIVKMQAEQQGVSVKRLEMEDWVTKSYVGRVMIAEGDKLKGVQLLKAADAFLQDGSKRYRELNNLLALIPEVGIIERYQLIARAVLLNYEHINNRKVWLQIIAQLPPMGPLPKILKPYLR